MDDKKTQKPKTLIEWMGFAGKPDFSKSRALGGLVGDVVVLLAVALFALVPILLLLIFQLAFSEEHAGVRNVGLVLAALVGAPVVIWRAIVAAKQAKISEDGLYNQKITEAAGDLHARRQVTQNWKDKDQAYDIWGDDVPKRVAAIDRLEGLVRERPEEAGRVSRLLSVYVRELSLENPAQVPPKGLDGDALNEWVKALPPARSDMQSAVQVLGRLREIENVDAEDLTFDLEGANLQNMRLPEADLQKAILGRAQLQKASLSRAQLQKANLLGAQLQGADLEGAQLQGANLVGAQLQGANLVGAQLQGANLVRAQLQGANLLGARLQGANLRSTGLQGADFYAAQLDENTALTAANLRGAAVRFVDDTSLQKFAPFFDDIFAAWGETLPDGSPRPEHWIAERDDLDWIGFQAAWRKWQHFIGFDPDDPK